jgi:ADP-ribosylglycohydrolase
MTNSISPKATGCLIGQCLGDALGYPIEGCPGDMCHDFMSNRVKGWFDGDEPSPEEWSGQYTDDSQLARELLESLVKNEGWNPEDYAGRIADIFHSNLVIGPGLACNEAAGRLIGGVPWTEAGCAPPSAGNGTAMRAAPVGMVFFDQPDAMIQIAHEQGWVTHHDPRCSAGSIAIAGAVALALKDRVKDASVFLKTLADWMKPFHSEFAELTLQLEEWLPLAPHEAVKVIAYAGMEKGFESHWPGISPFVIPSVLWSLYSFLKYPDCYWDAIATSISVGGDVDTTGAMTGAISGAYLGMTALPNHLVSRLNDHGTWGYEELKTLAESSLP